MLSIIGIIGLACFDKKIVFCEENPVSDHVVIPYNTIFVMPAHIIYEDAYTEQNLHDVDPGVKNMFETMSIAYAENLILKAGRKSVTLDKLTPNQKGVLENTYNILLANSEELVKVWTDKGKFAKDFALFQETCEADAILVHFVKVKIGRIDTLAIVLGASIPDTSITSLKMAMIDLKTGKTYWQCSSIARTMPNEAIIDSCLKVLYSVFPGNSEKVKK